MESHEGNLSELLTGIYENGDYKEAFEPFLNQLGAEDFSSATNVLVVGPGQGIREIAFLKKLVRNLKKATFLEPNGYCLEELKRTLTAAFDEQLEMHTHQCGMEEWQYSGEKFDLVLMFSCLYGMNDQQILGVLKKCFDQWLVPKGTLCVLMIDNMYKGQWMDSPCDAVYRQLGTDTQVNINHVKRQLGVMGRVFREYPFTTLMQLDQADEKFVKFIKYYCSAPKTEEEIIEAIEALKKKGYKATCVESVCMIDN